MRGPVRLAIALCASAMLAVIVAHLAAVPAAALVERYPLDRIADLATRILVGRVVGLDAHRDPGAGLIRTTVTLAVEHSLKGEPVDSTLAFDVPGGEVDGLALWVSDAATFAMGDRVIVFLSDGDLKTVGGFQGRFWTGGGRVYREGMQSVSLLEFVTRLAALPAVSIPESLHLEAQIASFLSSAGAPWIDSVSPGAGPAHQDHLRTVGEAPGCAADSTLVVITGYDFGAIQGSSYVTFFTGIPGYEGRRGCVRSWTDRRIEVWVPGRASSGDVRVQSPAGSSNPVSFTVTYSYAGGRWPKGTYAQPMSEVFLVNAAGAGTPGALGSAVAAMETWNNVPTAGFFFRYGGSTIKSDYEMDGENVISWVNRHTNSVATNYVWWETSDPNTIIESDIIFNALDYSWGTGGEPTKMDVQNTATHELGHSLQLYDLYGDADYGKTMFGYSSEGDTSSRTLSTDDIAGISYIYPGGYTATPTRTPSATVTRTASRNPTLTRTRTPSLTATRTATHSATPARTASGTPTPSAGPSPTRSTAVVRRARLPIIAKDKAYPGATQPTSTPTRTRMASPSPSRTRTATATRTRTPSATPTLSPPEVQILPNSMGYVDIFGWIHVLGEVYNGTSTNLWFIMVAVDFYDSNGALLGSAFAYVNLESLAPGQRTCFDVVHEEMAGVTGYSFQPLTYYTDASGPPALAVTDSSGSYDGEWGTYGITGHVRNDHGVQVAYVSVIGTLYDSVSTVVGCDLVYADNDTLAPGESSAFSLSFLGRDYSDVTSYRLQADGTVQ